MLDNHLHLATHVKAIRLRVEPFPKGPVSHQRYTKLIIRMKIERGFPNFNHLPTTPDNDVGRQQALAKAYYDVPMSFQDSSILEKAKWGWGGSASAEDASGPVEHNILQLPSLRHLGLMPWRPEVLWKGSEVGMSIVQKMIVAHATSWALAAAP